MCQKKRVLDLFQVHGDPGARAGHLGRGELAALLEREEDVLVEPVDVLASADVPRSQLVV